MINSLSLLSKFKDMRYFPRQCVLPLLLVATPANFLISPGELKTPISFGSLFPGFSFRFEFEFDSRIDGCPEIFPEIFVRNFSVHDKTASNDDIPPM